MKLTVEKLHQLLIDELRTVWGGCFDVKYDKPIYENSLQLFWSDYKRWFPMDHEMDLYKILLTPQLQVLLLYRLAHNCYISNTSLKKDADIYALLGRKYGQMEIFYSAKIGNGLKINHGVGTVIGARCEIGNNCTIHQNCTIGDRNGGRPIIGDNVVIYAGAMILGSVTIGSGSIVGANSVVIESCPDNSVLVGTPAKIIKTGSYEFA